MKRLLVVVPLLMGAVTTPPAWREDKRAGTEATAQVERDLASKPAPAAATAQVFVAPDNSVLYVTLIARKVTAEREASARQVVDSFLNAPKRAQLTSSAVTIEESSSRVADGHQIEASLAYTNDGIHVLGRLILVGDAEHLISISGECFVQATAAATTAAECKQALASLDPEVPAANRVAVALAPEGTAPTPPDKPGPSITDVPHTPVAPITVGASEPARVVDRRPVYVGAAIVLLAGVFWLLRRRREVSR